jgi:hypothetical protein
LFEDFPAPAIPPKETRRAKPWVVWGTAIIDHDDVQIGRLEDFQNAPADTAQATDDDRSVHDKFRITVFGV